MRDEHGSKSILLKGKNRARNLEVDHGKIMITINGIEFSSEPYILLHEHGIYFFDSYLFRKSWTASLNYPEGKKHKSNNEQINQLFSSLSIEKHLASLSASVEDETYRAAEVEVLNKIAAIDDFQRPDYLVKWIKKRLMSIPEASFFADGAGYRQNHFLPGIG